MNITKSKKYESRMAIGSFIVLIILIVFTAITQEIKSDKVATYKYYMVKDGEVLEDVAMRYYSDMYLPKAKSEIKKLNNMIESDVYAGQVLKIEVK